VFFKTKFLFIGLAPRSDILTFFLNTSNGINLCIAPTALISVPKGALQSDTTLLFKKGNEKSENTQKTRLA